MVAFLLLSGRYIGAQVPRRAAALVRKRAIVEGTYGSFDPLRGALFVPFEYSDLLSSGGWKPEWEEPRKIVSLRPYKGHERERTRQQRSLFPSFPFHCLLNICDCQSG